MPSVLVVDDERSIRTTLGAFLELEGYDVRIAEDCATAKKCIAEKDFDAVVTDIIMPKESGLCLLKYINEKKLNSQVIVMTGEPTVDTAVEAIRFGARDYLSKPVLRDALIKAVKQTVDYKLLLDEKQQLERENKEQRDNLERLVVERTKKLRQAMLNTAYATAAMMDLRDPYTAGHERRVGKLSGAIGRELGLPGHTIEGLHLIGCIHDIGKITVPTDILSKPSKLSALEYEIVKEHAQKGYEVLRDYELPWPAAEIVYQHHERLDGSGYPRGLRGDEIFLETQIISVADVVEAMSSHRPYRPSLGIEAALNEIEANQETLYNQDAVQACLKLFRDKGFTLEDVAK